MSRVVTISASYGAGGSWVGPQVAEQLGWRFIDRAIPVQVAERLDVPVEHAHVHDEAAAPRFTRLLARLPNTSGVVVPEPTTRRVLPRDRASLDRGRGRGRCRRARARRRDRSARPARRVPRAPRRSRGGARVPGDARRGDRRGRGPAPADAAPIVPGSTTSSTSTAPTHEIRVTTTWSSTRPRCRCRRASI